MRGLIKGIHQHSTMDAFSTYMYSLYDPNSLQTMAKLAIFSNNEAA